MISIIVPVYNAESFLEECIDSVINQTYKDWELILIDDVSKDNSRKIIDEYSERDQRIKKVFLNENKGAGVARNEGIAIASKRFIAFLDADDYWHKDKLEKQINFMLENNIEFSYTRYYELNQNDKVDKIILSPMSVSPFSLLFNNYIKTLTVIYDTHKMGKVYMPEYRKRQDWGLWFNILKKSKKAYCLKTPLAFYRTSNDSLSKNKLLLLKENFNFYKNFLKKSNLISFIMILLFLCVHLSFKFFGKKHIVAKDTNIFNQTD